MSAAPKAAPASATASSAAANSKTAEKESESDKQKKKDGWSAMESNPEVLTKFMAKLGVAKNFAFTDMLGLDPDLIAMIPAPVLAVVLLYPMPDSNAGSATATAATATATATAATATAAEVKQQSTTATAASSAAGTKEPFFLVQVSELDNACGTVATLHAIFNCASIQETIAVDSPIRAFMKAGEKLSAAERGALLATDKTIKACHDEHVVQGQTVSSGDASEDTEHHFVVYIPFNGVLYELDGMQPGPINRGKLTDGGGGDSFVTDAAAAISKHYLKNSKFGGSTSFSMLAITGNADAL